MTALVLLFALMLGHATAVVNLSCSDNATCIENMTKELVRSLREQKTVKLFDSLTVEPLGRRQARSNEGPLSRFLKNHAFSYDWGDLTFRVSRPEDRSDVLDFEIYEERSAKDVSDSNPKKSSSKIVEDKDEDKTPKQHKGLNRRRRQKKKVLMAVVPLLFGMKSTAVVLFAMAIVTVLTLKAFVASKLALLVTVGMAVKKLYESYSSGIPETSNVLWNLARYFRILFGLPAPPPLSHAPSMTIPMYTMPQMYSPEMYGQLGQAMSDMAMPSHT